MVVVSSKDDTTTIFLQTMSFMVAFLHTLHARFLRLRLEKRIIRQAQNLVLSGSTPLFLF